MSKENRSAMSRWMLSCSTLTSAAFVCSLGLLFGCAESVVAEPSDHEVILERLLAIHNPGFAYQDEQGQSHYDELAAEQRWQSLYVDYRSRVMSDGSAEALKYWLLLGFIADTRQDAALSEAFSSDLMPVFEQNPAGLLGVLAELPFLVEPTASYLANYFGFEDRNEEDAAAFVESNRALVNETLGETLARQFLTRASLPKN